MYQLSSTNLPESITLDYDRSKVTSSIVHFGVGNFHRTHQAVYCNKLLSKGETHWGITGISMRSPEIRDTLSPQDFIYTQVTLGDKTEFQLISAIKNILVAPENPLAVINAVANNQTQLVTTTITEKGYCLLSSEIDLKHSGIHDDLKSLQQPRTIYGYLAAAIIQRCQNNGVPFTILCCDNIQSGGKYLKNGVKLLLEHHSPSAYSWMLKNVAFSSSMVDRVSPTTDHSLKEKVADHWGVIDEWPVAAEPFSQWIIEDNFAGEKPPFDLVGATFVSDISAYEQMKLRFLNAGHSMVATLGYLAGDQFVHEALKRPNIHAFVEQALIKNVLPATDIPCDCDGVDYTQQVLKRFKNSALPYALLQVGTDSSQKIQQRWLPTIDNALSFHSGTIYLAFSLAAWVNYIIKAIENGHLNDPFQKHFEQHKREKGKDLIYQYLSIINANEYNFFDDQPFMESVHDYHHQIIQLGIEDALNRFLTLNLQCEKDA